MFLCMDRFLPVILRTIIFVFFLINFLSLAGLFFLINKDLVLFIKKTLRLEPRMVEGLFFYGFQLFSFLFNFILGFLPFWKNHFILDLFVLTVVFWLSVFFYYVFSKGFLRCLTEESNFFLAPLIMIINLVLGLYRPLVLFARMFVNFMLGEILDYLISFSRGSVFFLFCFYELFVFIVQTRIYCILLVFYIKH